MPTNNNREKQSVGLKSLDFMGSKFSLTFPTPTGRFQTNLGGSITILMGIVSVSFFVVVMSQYFNREAPMVTTSSEFAPNKVEFDLYRQLMFPAMNIFNDKGAVKNGWNRLITIKAVVTKEKYNETELTYKPISSAMFDYAPCKDLGDPQMSDYINRMRLKAGLSDSFLCPDLKNTPNLLTVMDDINNPESVSVKVHVLPCSLPADQCAPSQEIRTLKINFMEVRKLLEPSDFEKPLRNFMLRRHVLVEPKLEKHVNFDLQHNKVMDDISRFSPPKLKMEYSTATMSSLDYRMRNEPSTKCTQEHVVNGLCQPYITFNFLGSENVNIVRRSYKKWTEMLGEFGGILKVITSTMFFIYAFYNLWWMGSYLEGAMLAPTKKEAKEVKKLLGFDKKHKKRNNFQIAYTRVEPAGKRTKEEADPEKVLNSLLSTRLDVDRLMEKLNTIELIEKLLFFDEEHKKLVPLVLFNLTQRQLSEPSELDKSQSDLAKKTMMSQEGQNGFNSSNNYQGQKEVSYSNIYQSLLESRSSDPLKASMKELMIDNLQKTFKNINNQNFRNQGQGVNRSNQSEQKNVQAGRDRASSYFLAENESEEAKEVELPANPKKIEISFPPISAAPNRLNFINRRPNNLSKVSRGPFKKKSQGLFSKHKSKSKFGNLGSGDNQAGN